MRFSAMRGRSNMGKAILAAALIVSVPAVASATVYEPDPSDLNDLDHHKAYGWKIDVSNVQGQSITGATLQFNQLYNWNSQANRLYIHLFDNIADSAILGEGVLEYTDNPGDDDMDDAFSGGSTPSWIVGGNTNLTSRAFDQKDLIWSESGGVNNNDRTPGGYGPGDQMNAGATSGTWTLGDSTTGQWDAWEDGTDWDNVNGDWRKYQLYSYSYTFSTSEVSALNSYIDDGWIALGLDPDCHFFNSGLSLTLTSSPNVPAVPEPASVLLLGTGLAWAGFRRYRRRAVKA